MFTGAFCFLYQGTTAPVSLILYLVSSANILCADSLIKECSWNIMQRKAFPVSPCQLALLGENFIRVNLRVSTIAFAHSNHQPLIRWILKVAVQGEVTHYTVSQWCPQKGSQYQVGDNVGPYNELPVGFQRLPQKSSALITQVPGRLPWWRNLGTLGWLPVLAAVYVHLACQGRLWALQIHVHHKKLVHLRGILQHDHIVANLWDPQT